MISTHEVSHVATVYYCLFDTLSFIFLVQTTKSLHLLLATMSLRLTGGEVTLSVGLCRRGTGIPCDSELVSFQETKAGM